MPQSGGKLIFSLKNNYDQIVSFYRHHGPEATLSEYHITRRTLERLLAGGYGKPQRRTKADRAIDLANIAIASNSELRRELREMREEYSQLVSLVVQQLADRIIKAMQNIEVDIPPELKHQETDPLRIESKSATNLLLKH